MLSQLPLILCLWFERCPCDSTDLPNFPPNRDIDISIDLDLGTKPISISPYHMALGKLKELKDQDLLSKGFIHPQCFSMRMCINYQ